VHFLISTPNVTGKECRKKDENEKAWQKKKGEARLFLLGTMPASAELGN